MLKIKPHQVDAMIAGDDAAMHSFVLRSLRENSAEYLTGLSPEWLDQQVRFSIAKAREYGFSSPVDVLTFVTVMFEVSPSFDQQPDINAVLKNTTIPVEEKFSVLTEPRFDDAWEDADEKYDASAWHPVE